ncbi:MAG: hypothetical protein WCC73_12020, partial [Terracidiphilus sp.]
ADGGRDSGRAYADGKGCAAASAAVDQLRAFDCFRLPRQSPLAQEDSLADDGAGGTCSVILICVTCF